MRYNKKSYFSIRYRNNAEVVSSKFRDRLNTPVDTAVFWIEYVIRHKGAPELRSEAAFLPWYQYYLVDVVFVLLGVVLFSLYFIYFVISKLIALVTSKKQKKIKKS